MKYADLHIHSNYSDGTMTPEEIIDEAIGKGLKCISITDHDSLASQYVTNKKLDNISIIPGIELSTEFKDLEIHMLGYNLDIENESLNKVVNKLNKCRLDRIEEMLFELKKHEIHLGLEDLDIDSEATVGRSHIANAMVKKGYFDNYKAAFTSYLVRGKPAYVKGFKLEYKESIDLIIEAGGVPVLAHPGQIYRGMGIEKIIREFKCYGLKGIEAYHPSHTKEQTNYFYNLATKYKMCITGGSDYHGMESLHNSGIGSCGINEKLLQKVLYKK
ncbi:MAG: PHP domain-containing protein [Clostridium sp.]